MVAVWFAVTDGAVNSPAALIVPRFVLQVGVTAVFVPSLQAAVAVYVAVAPSFTDATPLIAMLLRVTAAELIVKVNTFVAVAEAPSVTRTVKLGVGTAVAAVGVPLRTPAGVRLRPAGSDPADTVQLFVPVPPEDTNVSGMYAVPTVPAVREPVEIESAAAAGKLAWLPG